MLGIRKVLDQIQKLVERIGKVLAVPKSFLEKVNSVTLHANTHHLGNILLIQGLGEDEIHDLQNALRNIGIFNLLFARLHIFINAGIFQ